MSLRTLTNFSALCLDRQRGPKRRIKWPLCPPFPNKTPAYLPFSKTWDKAAIFGSFDSLSLTNSIAIIIPFPLQPFPINIENTFKIKSLREEVHEFKIIIKQANESVECKLVELEKNSYSVTFTPKTIERHTVEIYFDDVLVNAEQLIKIDVFDVSKIKARMPSSITFGEMNTFTGKNS